MLIPTIIMGVLAVILFVVAYMKGGDLHLQGLKATYKLMLEIMPLLIFSFIVASLVQLVIPRELLSRWVGVESGLRGIIIGTLAGAMTPGGPYVNLPIAAGLLKSGASISTMVAFLTGWSLWAIHRLPMEIGILGWRFTLIRFACTFFLPPLAGLLAHFLFSNFKI